MNKIPTVFVRDLSKQPALVIPEWHPDCLWVRDGEGHPTRKYDGTCCMVRAGRLYKRHELQRHAWAESYVNVPREFEGLKSWLAEWMIEGLVWHHPDGRMAKIKRRDFGLKW